MLKNNIISILKETLSRIEDYFEPIEVMDERIKYKNCSIIIYS